MPADTAMTTLSYQKTGYLMQCMGLVKHRTTTKAKLDVKFFEEIKKGFLLDIHNVMEMDEIPPDLIMNFDQTAVPMYQLIIGRWPMKEANM